MGGKANNRQVGGTHYKKLEYQPWDLIVDVGIPYLHGCAIKYVSRWKDKGGIKDLEKALHYIEKSKGTDVKWISEDNMEDIKRYALQFPPLEAIVITYITLNFLNEAEILIQLLIEKQGEK